MPTHSTLTGPQARIEQNSAPYPADRFARAKVAVKKPLGVITRHRLPPGGQGEAVDFRGLEAGLDHRVDERDLQLLADLIQLGRVPNCSKVRQLL
jgi:hypothetical protein